MYPTDPVDAVRQWLKDVVIGLNLCPFAHKPFAAEAIRFCTVETNETEEILHVLQQELDFDWRAG
jgi:uncharacterized protein